jgi:hypothetical protein
MPSTPFYFDWQFWSAVAAFAALILSQLPPLKQILRKGIVTIEKYETLYLSHTIGSPSAHLFVILKNVGNTTINVQSISLSITRKNSNAFLLKGRGYQINPTDNQFVMLVPFEIAPNTTWAHTINFIDVWNRDSQKEYKNIYIKIRDSINEKNKIQPMVFGSQQEADLVAYENLCNFFKHNFKWLDGEYEAEILVKNKAGDIIAQDSVVFTLFESESDELKSWVADYKFGYGIHLPASQNQVGVWVNLSN